MCVMFHYKARGWMCFLPISIFLCIYLPTSTLLLCFQDTKCDSKIGSWTIPQTLNWINTARLIFPLDEYPVHVAVFPLLSSGVKLAGSPFCVVQCKSSAIHSHNNRGSHHECSIYALFILRMCSPLIFIYGHVKSIHNFN